MFVAHGVFLFTQSIKRKKNVRSTKATRTKQIEDDRARIIEQIEGDRVRIIQQIEDDPALLANKLEDERARLIKGSRDLLPNTDVLERSLLPLYTYKTKAGKEVVRLYPRSTVFTLANIDELEKGKPPVALLEDDKATDSKAFRDFVRTIGIEPEVHVIGWAQALDPEKISPTAPLVLDHRPGRQVSHHEGESGTLGIYVKDNVNPNIIGFCSASHVLLWNRANTHEDDAILSPAPPPEERRDLKNTYGRVAAGRLLVPYTNAAAADVKFNTVDIAWARLEKPSNTPKNGNEVPKPGKPSTLVTLKSMLTPEELKSRAFRRQEKPFSVYKIGRSSGYTEGEIIAVYGSPKSISFRSASYLYDDYCVVRPRKGFPSFSEDGDSGAVVYTEDLMIVGFIVAGTSQGYSLLHVAYDCLASLEVNPL